jgi:hypothetical protein
MSYITDKEESKHSENREERKGCGEQRKIEDSESREVKGFEEQSSA